MCKLITHGLAHRCLVWKRNLEQSWVEFNKLCTPIPEVPQKPLVPKYQTIQVRIVGRPDHTNRLCIRASLGHEVTFGNHNKADADHVLAIVSLWVIKDAQEVAHNRIARFHSDLFLEFTEERFFERLAVIDMAARNGQTKWRILALDEDERISLRHVYEAVNGQVRPVVSKVWRKTFFRSPLAGRRRAERRSSKR